MTDASHHFAALFLIGLSLSPLPTQHSESPPVPIGFPGNLSEISLMASPTMKEFLDLAVPLNLIRETGAAGRNRNGFLEISAQRAGTKMILRGLADRDEQLIERGVRAIEYGFRRQHPDGSFANGLGLPETNPDALEADAFFLQAVGHAYLILRQSSYAERFLPRFDHLKPRIAKALQWLETYQEVLERKAERAPNRLMFDALAFSLNGRVINREQYRHLGDRWVMKTLRKQRADGVFPEHEGGDSGYQAVTLLLLQIYALYASSPDLRNRIAVAVQKGITWEKTRIRPDGKVDTAGNTRTGRCRETFFGRCKEVNYPEVILCFLYHARLFGDPESAILAQKILRYAWEHRRHRPESRRDFLWKPQ